MHAATTVRRVFALTATTSLSLIGVACNVDASMDNRRPPKGAPIAKDDESTTTVSPGASASALAQQEVDLVENVLSTRNSYQQSLSALRDYYRERGYATKQSWADFELEGFRKVKKFRYVLEGEVASAELRPTEQIAEADALYQRGLDLMKKGGHGVPVFYRQKTMIEAADVFKELVEKYPTSDRIDDAAFFLGEIHKEYLPDQEQIAAKWYERAFTWDPTTPHPARFQAAVIYDFRLHDRDRALELYRASIKDEGDTGSNARFATRRIKQLDENRGEDKITARMIEKDPREP